MKFKYFSQNGKILLLAQARISLLNLEYAYGFGVYESLRVVDSVSYFLNLHLNRLLKSAAIIGLEHPVSQEECAKWVKDLLAKLKPKICNLKIMLIGANRPDEAQLYIFPVMPFFIADKFYKIGVTAVSAYYERPLPKAKTLSMLMSYLAFKKARENNCYEALAIDRQGCVREGTRSNFFVIKDSTIFTPPAEKILDGVTRKIVLDLAANNGFIVKEAEIRLNDLLRYDGAFLTSTSSKVLPLRKIDNFEYPEIPAAIIKLEKLYDDFLKKRRGK